MPKSRVCAAIAATALSASALGAISSSSSAAPLSTSAAQNATTTSYVLLGDKASDATRIADQLRAQGVKVTSVNTAIGMVVAESKATHFRSAAAKLAGVEGVAANDRIGSVPVRNVSAIEQENMHAAKAGHTTKAAHHKAAHHKAVHHKAARKAKSDPLDSNLWGMRMINADKAHAITLGSRKVKVGIIDTGVQADHPDLHPNFDYRLSRNFVTDMPAIDGPCEHPSCVDPVGEDDGGHGSHVSGTIAAAMNHFGVSGVAPKTDLVEVRAGQDSGYFFLAPTVNALTYSGDAGLDVVNMSFYVDPWLYNCNGGAPEDTPAQAADQDTIIEAMNRALNYAHDKGVTLVAATGNNHEDLANPRHDFSSPDFGEDPHERTIANSNCFDLPVEGPHVIGVDAIGPSGKKSDFSNYTTDLTSGEVEVSAPGGWYRDGFGTASYRANENLILSTVPLVSVQETGEVDAAGNVTPLGESTGVKKVCQADPAPGKTVCGYYAFYQGTSMATPHVAGVAALAVAAHGVKQRRGGFGLAPDSVRALVMGTATDHACPTGGVQDYLNEGRSAQFTATCLGTPEFNGFYGDGIVNALGVVS